MDYLKGGGEFPVESASYVVENSGTIEDGPVPVFAWYLFICEVGAGHLDEIPPGAFEETVGALSLGESGDDLVLVVVDPPEALPPHEFAVEVSVELVGEADNVRP